MNVLWFATRNRVDLCSTTLDALAKGLTAKGHQVTVINSDQEGSHAQLPWKHVSVKGKAVRGRKARVLGLEMRDWLTNATIDHSTVAIVDWRIANMLHSTLLQKSIPWVLMDRSPPADKGILARLQWPVWKKAWKLVKNKVAFAGCAVSHAHMELIHSKVGVSMDDMVSIPAGVDVSVFHCAKRNDDLTLVYHGRLDRHRGVLSLPLFQQKLANKGLHTKFILIGEGDAKAGLQRMAERQENLQIIDTLPHEQLADVLACAHIGLLPMPDSEVWAIASPLKRSEYAASGLLIYGIDHRGHRFEQKKQPEWLQLVRQEDFHDDGCAWIQALSDETLSIKSKQARAYAEEHLDWSISVDALEMVCSTTMNAFGID